MVGTFSVTRPPLAAFAHQLELVLNWAELREERAGEILAQIDNQFPFFGSVVYMHPARTPRTLPPSTISSVAFACIIKEKPG